MAQEFWVLSWDVPGHISSRAREGILCGYRCRAHQLSDAANREGFLPQILAKAPEECNCRKQPIVSSLIPFYDALSDRPERTSRRLHCVCRVSVSGSLDRVMLGVLCDLAKIRHRAFLKTITL